MTPPGDDQPAEPQAAGGLWVLSRPTDLSRVQWDEHYSLFDRGTGMTHLLNEFPVEILRRLAAGPLSVEALASGLAADCGVPDDAAWRRKVEGTLSSLGSLELVERRRG